MAEIRSGGRSSLSGGGRSDEYLYRLKISESEETVIGVGLWAKAKRSVTSKAASLQKCRKMAYRRINLWRKKITNANGSAWHRKANISAVMASANGENIESGGGKNINSNGMATSPVSENAGSSIEIIIIIEEKATPR